MCGLLDDIFGKHSPRQMKHDVLSANRRRGQAEAEIRIKYELNGYEVDITGRGHDFRVRRRDIWTGQVSRSRMEEAKTRDARLSPLQRKTKKRQSNYTVEHVDPFY